MQSFIDDRNFAEVRQIRDELVQCREQNQNLKRNIEKANARNKKNEEKMSKVVEELACLRVLYDKERAEHELKKKYFEKMAQAKLQKNQLKSN